MTVMGYMTLYSAHAFVMGILFCTLEVAKATICGLILPGTDKLRYKTPLVTLSAILVIVSFVGHISFLSASYAKNRTTVQVSNELITKTKDTHETQLNDIDYQISMIKEQIQQGKDEIKNLTETATGLQTANARNWALGTNKKRIKEIQDQNLKLMEDIKELSAQKSQIMQESLTSTRDTGKQIAEATNRSVFQYTADIFGTTQDRLATFINFILALVIDTLALVMLWVAGEMWKQRKTIIKRQNTIKRKELDKELVITKMETQPLHPAKANIKKENLDEYLFEGNTVQDVVEMTDEEVEALKAKVRTQDQLDWLNFALTIRNHGHTDLTFEELK